MHHGLELRAMANNAAGLGMNRLTCWFWSLVLTRSSGKTQVTPMMPAMPPLMILGRRANWGTAETVAGYVFVEAAIFHLCLILALTFSMMLDSGHVEHD